MKKLLLLFLLVAGGVSTASADEVTIYFQPNGDWKSASATFKLYGYTSSDAADAGSVKDMSSFSDDGNGIYSAKMDISTYPYIRFGRYASDGNTFWNKTSEHYFCPTVDTYYIMTGSNYGDWNYYDCTSTTYFPWRYYFMTAASKNSDTWSVDDDVTPTESSGTYTFTISGATYAGKRVGWAPGDSFNSDGSLSSWDKVCKSKTTANNDDWIIFQNFSYGDVIIGNTGSAWFVPADDDSQYNDGTITITFNSSTEAATITCAKTATIGPAGYITYSNGEKCTISGATAYKVSANKTSTVTLTEMSGATIWPASEGMILKGSNGDKVTINAVASGATATTIGTNYLVGNGNSASTPSAGDGIYVFSWNGSDPATVGFYKAADDKAELAAHKAYLDISGASAREFLGFDFGEATGINNLTPALNDGAIYDLQGRRVAQPTKGLYIINGKKVIK